MANIIQTLPYEVFNEAEKVNALFDLGLEVLHIRKPQYTKDELENFIVSIDKKYHNKLVLHSQFGLVKKYGLGGIHVDYASLNSLFTQPYYKYIKSKYGVSISTSTSKLSSEKLNNELIDYILLGPIFIKYSEASIVSKINLFELKKVLSSCEKGVYALGCSSIESINMAMASGFSGVSLQSYIWKSDDIVNAFKTIALNSSEEKTSSRKELAV